MALVLSGAMGIATYELARWYLLDKREALAMRQATLNAVAIKGQLAAGGPSSDPMSALQESDARALLRVGDTWYSAVVQIGEDTVTPSLRESVAAAGAARQRVLVDRTPYLAYGFRIPQSDAEYYEFVSASEYERTLSVLAVILSVAASVTTIGGAVSGESTSGLPK